MPGKLSRHVLDVLNSPWAITPDMLDTIAGIYMARVRGEQGDLAEFEARYEDALGSEEKPYDVVKGVALINVHGVMAKRMNLFHAISGGCSHRIIGNHFKLAMKDRAVKAVLLDVDTPGGTVDGTEELAQLIYQGRSEKRIVAYADGLMASAGYWTGSAAHEVVLSSGTTDVGSIGVVATHVDFSENDKMRGIKRTEIYAGKYKRIVSENKPLDGPGTQYMQDRVDYLYGLFLNAVAMHLGTEPETVHEQMADGRIFTGQQAIDAGLATRIVTREELLEELATTGSTSVATNPRATAAQSTTERPTMDKATIEKEHPEIAAAFRKEGEEAGLSKGREEGKAQGLKEGAEAERKRIQDVEAQSMPGHEALINTLKFDGKTTGDQAASQVLAAEKAAREKAGEDFRSEAPKPQKSAPNKGMETEVEDKPVNSAALAKAAQDLVAAEEAKGNKLSYAAAVRMVKEQQT